jgi:hypothetical protein
MKSDPFAYDPDHAYYGPLGEIAKRCRDHIPINLLPFYSMLLTAVGSLVGRRVVHSYFRDRHFCILFNTVVGKTGCGKGTSLHIVQAMIEEIDQTCTGRISFDVASAPGLIDLVRDSSKRVEGKRVIEDEGVTDKRLLVALEEMENLFVAIGRKGSTVDKVLNMAYDGRTLQTAARAKQKATNPHISFIGQITPEPFRDLVARGHGCTNGFFNRFLTVCATKERSRPHGADLPDVSDLIELIRRRLADLGDPLTPTPKEIRWHESSHEAWGAFVAAMEGDHPFLHGLGGMSARLISNTVRVAMILTVIDGADAIMPRHLNAAKSFCLQCIDSSRGFFTKNGGPKTQTVRLRDRILAGIGDEHRTLTEIHEMLHKKGYNSETLRDALAALVSSGQLVTGTRHSATGRQLPVWTRAVHTDAAWTESPTPTTEPPQDSACDAVPEDPLPVEAEVECDELPEEDEPQEDDPAIFSVDGMRLRMVTPFEIKYDADALTTDGRPTGVRRGQTGFMVAVEGDPNAPEADKAFTLIQTKPNHVLVLIDGELLFVKPRSLQIEADALVVA